MITSAISQDSLEAIHQLFLLGYICIGAAAIWACGYFITSSPLLRQRIKGIQWYISINVLVLLIIGVISLLAFEIAYRAELIRTLSTFSGSLTPADDAVIPACGGQKQNALQIFVGNDLVIQTMALPLNILSIDGKPFISLEKREDGGVGVSARIYNKDGKLLVDVLKGAFNINRNLVFSQKRPDFHTLIVKDDAGVEVLYIRFSNTTQMIFLSKLFYPGVGRIDPLSQVRELCAILPKGGTFMNYKINNNAM